jgi:hypothetical protein
MRSSPNSMYLFTSVSRPQYVLKATEQLVATCKALAKNPLDPVSGARRGVAPHPCLLQPLVVPRWSLGPWPPCVARLTLLCRPTPSLQ